MPIDIFEEKSDDVDFSNEETSCIQRFCNALIPQTPHNPFEAPDQHNTSLWPPDDTQHWTTKYVKFNLTPRLLDTIPTSSVVAKRREQERKAEQTTY